MNSDFFIKSFVENTVELSNAVKVDDGMYQLNIKKSLFGKTTIDIYKTIELDTFSDIKQVFNVMEASIYKFSKDLLGNRIERIKFQVIVLVVAKSVTNKDFNEHLSYIYKNESISINIVLNIFDKTNEKFIIARKGIIQQKTIDERIKFLIGQINIADKITLENEIKDVAKIVQIMNKDDSIRSRPKRYST